MPGSALPGYDSFDLATRSAVGLLSRMPATLNRAIVGAVLPAAWLWAAWHESAILRKGVALSTAQLEDARKIGVVHPEKVRLLAVASVPPNNPLLRFIGAKLGLGPSQTIGMTLRYGIFIRSGHWHERRLLLHELAHVAQYERLGGIGRFLFRYIRECITPGYPFGELELEAKRAEDACQ
jgi:hypothetical protein